MREKIAEPIEQLEALDAVLEPLQKAVQTVVPQQSQLKDVLSGTWLGEPLHPPLTDVVIGTWTSALLLDLLGGEQAQKAADGLVAAGVLAAVPTLTAGLSDWAELSGGSRRVGGVHALGNTTALVLHALSLGGAQARRQGAPAWPSPCWGTPSRRSPPTSAGISPSPGGRREPDGVRGPAGTVDRGASARMGSRKES